MNGIRIREVKLRDLGGLSTVYSQVYGAFDVGEHWTKGSAYKMLKYWLERDPDLAFLAERDGRIIGGFLVGVKPWWDGNHLVDGEIFVHPDYQKAGVGTQLLKFVTDYARKKYGAVRFDTYTVRGKYPVKWYKSLGFSEIKEWIMISADSKKLSRALRQKRVG
jgi:GNAT superfamily N-acetyltransferase